MYHGSAHVHVIMHSGLCIIASYMRTNHGITKTYDKLMIFSLFFLENRI